MLKRTKVTLAAVILLTSGAAFAYSHHGKGMHHARHQAGPVSKLERAFAHLDLTEEQQAQLEQIKLQNKDELMVLGDQNRTLKHQMMLLVEAPQTDASAIRSLSQQMAEKRADQLIKSLQVRDEAVAILTPEQLAKFNLMREKQKQKRKAKRQAVRELME